MSKLNSSNGKSDSSVDLAKLCKDTFNSVSLPNHLRREARAFVGRVHKLLVSDESPENTADFADKFKRLKPTSPQVSNLFYSPEFFSNSSWTRMTAAEKIQIISAGVKVVRPLITGASHKPARKNSSSNENTKPTPKEAAPYAEMNITPEKDQRRQEPTPSANVSLKYNSSNSAETNKAHPRTDIGATLYSGLTIDVRKVTWGNNQFQGVLKSHGVASLLDLANLSVSKVDSLLEEAKMTRKQMHHALTSIQREETPGLGQLISLLLAPLGNKPGGLCLSNGTVSQLASKMVKQSRWYDNKQFGFDIGNDTNPIDNGFRLLRHYDHAKMQILSSSELKEVQDIFSRHF